MAADNISSASVAAGSTNAYIKTLETDIAGLRADLALAWKNGHIMAVLIFGLVVGAILGHFVL